MKYQLVSTTHLWQRPSDVLFIPWNSESVLQQQVDWYLNFNISKAFRHKNLELIPEQLRLLQDVGLDFAPAPPVLDDQVICLAPAHFFSRYVVAMKTDVKKSLAERFNQTMFWLKASRGSILLPPSISSESFEASLQRLGFDKEVIVTMDVNPTPE